MEQGRVHVYCGEGKGKTTCAMGLALRALGCGMEVTLIQFLKSEDSGERRALAQLPHAHLIPVPEQMKFSFSMNEEERQWAAARFAQMMDEAEAAAHGGTGQLVVLDEVCAAVNSGLLPLERVTRFLDCRPPETEVVLTGRNPSAELTRRADYITEMKKLAHPYDKGIPARRGIEY